MDHDIDKITSPVGARDAFKLLMTEVRKVSSPLPGFRSGTFFSVGLAIDRLPNPQDERRADIFSFWVYDAKTSLRIWESAKSKPKFKEAKLDFLDKLRGILGSYLYDI